MRSRQFVLAIAICASLAPVGASAQLFKCKGPDGKIVYSDTRCEASDKGALKVTPMSTTPSEREKAEAAKAAEAASMSKATDAAGKGAPPPSSSISASAPSGYTPYELTGSDKDRMRNLEVTAGSMGAYSEQKSAARLEISNIRSGRDAMLSADQRSRRDSLTTDLASTDAKKRRQVLEDLRAVYY